MNQEQTEEELPPSKRLKLDNDILALNNDIIGTEIDFTGDNIDLGDKKFVINDVDYSNFVNPEELERLREFKVLDEVKSNDEDSNDDETSSFDGKSDGLPEDEIEKMLEEDLPDGFKGAPKPKEKPYVTHQKVVLEEKGVNPFEVLPLDWIMVRHYSGMPIYMHRPTRVCTISKPYFLGKGNTRRHDVPISAIPCLAYRRALEEEAKHKVIDKKIEEQIRNGTWRNTDKQTQQTHTENLAINSSNKENGSEEKSAHSYQSIEGSTHSEENIALPDQNIVALTHSVEKGALPDQNIVALTHSEEKGALPDQNIVELTHSEEKGALSDQNIVALTHSEEKGALPDQNIVASTEESSNTNQEIPRCPFSATEASQGTPPADGDQEIPSNRQPVVLPGGIVMLPPRVESVNSSWKTQHLTPDNINEYCKNLFKFKTVNIMHFKRWADRRKYTKARKTLQYPTLPKGTKLITIPAQPAAGQQNGGGKANKRDWVMNMNGRSYLSVFHEYVHQALQKQPVYEFKQLQNASTPYQATVFIGGMQYGVGHGSSKRQAKSAAARASIHILIPEMKDDMDAHAHSRPDPDSTEPDFTFFDNVGIEDPRITEFCAATCEPSPHAILRTCLVRNFGAGDRHIHTEMKKLEYQKVELTMKVGKHSATVACKNKKTAKQRASQAILQALHPHVRSWGSLLRLYGSRSMKSCKEKKQEEQQITLLQDQARHNQPNHAVLRKLRHEMARLRDRDRAVVPIGTLLLAHDLPTHSGSNLNNVDL